jgi:hypothetical protein
MDLIMLFYQDSDYSLSVKEFLDGYFSDVNTHTSTKESIWAQSQNIKGRCGYIRQSWPFVIKDYDFSRIKLLVDGFNTQLSDIDFYHATIQAVTHA